MKRPSRNDDEIIAAAVEKLLPEVLEWAGDEYTAVELLEPLRRALRHSRDGYSIARELEGVLDPDSELVEVLDSAGHYITNAWEKACIAWVAENGLEGPPVGSLVTSKALPNAGQGTVTKHYPEGKAVVRFPALGHVEKGEGCHGLLINWEDLELVTP